MTEKAPAPEAPVAPLGDDVAVPRESSRAATLFLALLAFMLYLPSLSFDLVYDDWFLISSSELMEPVAEDFSTAFEFFGHEYWDGINLDLPEGLRARGQALYRPLTLFTWACVYALQPAPAGQPNAPVWGYHLVNILMNVLVVLLLHRVVLRLTGSGRIAFVAAGIFALHPLHAEAVAYVAGLSDLYGTATVLGGLLLYLRATREPGRLAPLPYLGMLVVLFVGMLAKEQAVLLIAVVALLDFVRWRAGRAAHTVGTLVAAYGGLLAVLAGQLALRYSVLGYLRPQPHLISRIDNPLVAEDFLPRLYTGLKILAMEVWLFLWPAELSIDYSFNAIPVARSFGHIEVLTGALLIGSLVAWGLVKSRRHPALAFGVLFFTGAALFTANIIQPIGTIFGERLAYLPSAGGAMAVAVLFDALVRRTSAGAHGPLPAWAAAVLVVLGFALGARTYDRSNDFQSRLDMWESAREVVPESARVHFQLGVAYSRESLYTAAKESLQKALTIDPSFLQAAISLGNVHAADRNFERAIQTFDEILAQLERVPGEDSVQLQRMVYLRRGLSKRGAGDVEGGIYDMERAASLASGTNDDALVHLAQMLLDRGRPEDALSALTEYSERHPEQAHALFLMAQIALELDDDEAYENALQAMEESPSEEARASALAMRAEVLYEQSFATGDAAGKQEALRMFDEARELNPDLPTPYIYRGRFLAERERYFDAILEFDLALDRHEHNPFAIFYKAIAQLAARRYEDALESLLLLESVRPDVRCYTLLSEAYFWLGDVEGMERAFQRLEQLGESPAIVLLNRVVALKDQGKSDEAIDMLERYFVLPEYANDPRLLRSYAILLYEVGRHEEALAAFDKQAEIEQTMSDEQRDPFLPINRARTLIALERDVEAAAELDAVAARVEPDSYVWPSVLHYRAALALHETGPFADPARALELATEGLEKTSRRHAPFFDLAMEAHVALGEIAEARALADEAAEIFADEERFDVARDALALAADGDRDGAIAALRAGDDPALAEIAQRL